MSSEPCMCGAIDCPSCGRAQGYDVRRIGGRVFVVEDDTDLDALEVAEDTYWEETRERRRYDE